MKEAKYRKISGKDDKKLVIKADEPSKTPAFVSPAN